MPPQVRRHPDFLADLEAQVLWLDRNRDARRILRLREAVYEATRALARFPNMGAPVALGDPRDAAAEPLRKLILRGVPFIVWYAIAGDDVWLFRLFHARQERPHARRRAKRR